LDRLLSAARSALFACNPAEPARSEAKPSEAQSGVQASRAETDSTDATRARGDRSKGDPDQRL
jgi:hypothetical protein